MSKVGKYLRITSMQTTTAGLMIMPAGTVAYWRISIDYSEGGVIAQYGASRVFVTLDEIKAGVRGDIPACRPVGSWFMIELVNRRPGLIAKFCELIAKWRVISNG